MIIGLIARHGNLSSSFPWASVAWRSTKALVPSLCHHSSFNLAAPGMPFLQNIFGRYPKPECGSSSVEAVHQQWCQPIGRMGRLRLRETRVRASITGA